MCYGIVQVQRIHTIGERSEAEKFREFDKFDTMKFKPVKVSFSLFSFSHSPLSRSSTKGDGSRVPKRKSEFQHEEKKKRREVGEKN